MSDTLAQTIHVLDTLGIPALFCRPDRIVQQVNEAAAVLLHDESHRLQGAMLDELEGFDELAKLIRDCERTPTVQEVTIGLTLHCQVRLRQVGDEGCLVILNDISEYHEREKYQRDAMHMVAHDLNTPISVVKSYADLINQMGSLTPPQLQFLDRIKLAAEHMSRLVRDLLDLTWIDTNAPLELETTRLQYVVQTVVENLRTTAAEKRIDLRLTAKDDLPPIQGDPGRLSRVINNLLSNAIKFSPAGLIVSIDIDRQSENELRIAVTDNGPGIPEEHLARIFDRFYRVPQSEDEQNAKGSGLGLAIVNAIIEKHGGRVEVKSKVGEGTTFIICLPVET
ncbi:MAG: HAMP domain-containing histidine kinase [Chloroflexi bacterium]|nr:HAMP domain-containing histidine kinase [Chloroflexota bacterium]